MSEQVVAAVERRIGQRTSLELSYVDKQTTDILEDTCTVNLGFASDCSFFVVGNLANLRRDYEGAIVTMRTRADEWVNLLASYTYSESEGNIEWTQSRGRDFDNNPGVFSPVPGGGQGSVNRGGLLTDDRKHRFKVNGYVLLPLDFTLGIGAYWSSNFRWTPVGTDGEFSEGRGARDGNENYQLDLQLTKGC